MVQLNTTSCSLDERLLRLLPRVAYRVATKSAEREAIFRLRYEAYLAEDAIAPNAERRFADHVDEAANCYLLGVYIDGRLGGSMRLSISDRRHPGIPTARVFPDVLEPLIANGQVIVDPTRFVGAREVSREFPELPYLTVRAAWMAAEHFEADLLLAAVRPEHQAFYMRLLGHQPLCGPRPYPNLVKPVALMGLQFPRMRESVLARHPAYASSESERQAIFGARFPAMAAVRALYTPLIAAE